MRVLVAAVGRVGSSPLAEALAEYEERVGRYFDFRLVEVASGGGNGAAAATRREEGERLLDRVPEELEWFGLTRHGKGMTSRRLARYLEELGTYGMPGAAFLVGGAYGLDDRVLDRCRYRLSLSLMTLPHEMARLVLVEQLYRAGTIIRGEPYHKGE